MTVVDWPESQPEPDPGHTSAALAAVGCSQIIAWFLIASLFASAFQIMGGPSTTGETAGEWLIFLFAFSLVAIGGAYVALISGHRRPFVRLFGGLTVFVLTFLVSASILFRVEDVLTFASPFFGVGAMLAFLLPEAAPAWKLARIASLGIAGLAVIAVLAALDQTRDISTSVVAWAMIGALIVGLAAIRVLEAARTWDDEIES